MPKTWKNLPVYVMPEGKRSHSSWSSWKGSGPCGTYLPVLYGCFDPKGVETIEKTVAGESSIEGDEGFKLVAEKMLTLLDYSNEDALCPFRHAVL